MKLRKTDKRFNLYCYGFDCYIEFKHDDWQGYNKYLQYCRKQFGGEFWHFASRVYEDGKWKGVHRHRTKRRIETKRIYFRGEKYHTLLLMAMPLEDKDTFYL